MARVLGLVASACGGVERRLHDELAEPAARRGWRLAITFTPLAHRWLTATGELARIAPLTDLPVRAESRLPTEPRPHPDPECFLFAPASANSVAKLALGLCDNQALTALAEAVGNPHVPVVVAPQVNAGQAGHPAWSGHLAALRSAGVRLEPLVPGRGWTALLDVVDELIHAST